MVPGSDLFLCRALLRTKDADQQDNEVMFLPAWADQTATVCWEADAGPASAFAIYTEIRDHLEVKYNHYAIAKFPGGCGGNFVLTAYDEKAKCIAQRAVHFDIHELEPEVCVEF
jgi:hypothetical protein